MQKTICKKLQKKENRQNLEKIITCIFTCDISCDIFYLGRMRLFEFLQWAFGPCRDDDFVRLSQKVLDDGCAKAFTGASHNEYF